MSAINYETARAYAQTITSFADICESIESFKAFADALLAELSKPVAKPATTAAVIHIYVKGGATGGVAILERSTDGYRKEITVTGDSATHSELLALREALKLLKTNAPIVVHSDLSFIRNAITYGWVKRWSESEWINSGKQPVAYADVWAEILPSLNRLSIKVDRVQSAVGHRMTAIFAQMAKPAEEEQIFEGLEVPGEEAA